MLVEAPHAPGRVPIPLLLGLLFKELHITRDAGGVFCCCYFACLFVCFVNSAQARAEVNWKEGTSTEKALFFFLSDWPVGRFVGHFLD